MAFLAVPIAFVFALLVEWAMNELSLGHWRRTTKDAHWTERARKLYPIRRSARLNVWLFASTSGFAYWMAFRESAILLCVGLASFAAWTGATFGNYPLVKEIYPQFGFCNWLRHALANFILRFGTVGTLLLAAILMPQDFGWMTIAIGLSVLGLQIAVRYGLWMQFGQKCRLFKKVDGSDQIHVIVRATSVRMRIPFREIWLLRSPIGYAAAFPITKDLLFSEGLLSSHPEPEIAAICSHELAHLGEPRNVWWRRFVGSFCLFPLIFLKPIAHLFDFGGLLLLGLPWAVYSVGGRRLGRKMEMRADSIATKHQGDSGLYARALERLYRTNGVPAVIGGLNALHPDLYDRMLLAGIMPEYPRPEQPEKYTWSTGLMMLFLICLFVVMSLQNQ